MDKPLSNILPLIPWSLVDTIERCLSASKSGGWGNTLAQLRIDFDFGQSAVAAWITAVVMDVSLFVLLSCAGLQSPTLTPYAEILALLFFRLYSSIGLLDPQIAGAMTHCLCNVLLADWILEGFMRALSRDIDERTLIDGQSRGHVFLKIFIPLISSGIGVASVYCVMFIWLDLLLGRTLASDNVKTIGVATTRRSLGTGLGYGPLSAAGALSIIPGALLSGLSATSLRRALPSRGCHTPAERLGRGEPYRRLNRLPPEPRQ